METFGRLAVSIITLGVFCAFGVYVFVWGVPPEARDILLQMVGALIAWATTIIGYWVGSSAGSSSKDDTIKGMADPNAAIDKMSDAEKVKMASDVPGVSAIVIKNGTGSGLGKLAASDDQPNIMTEAANKAGIETEIKAWSAYEKVQTAPGGNP